MISIRLLAASALAAGALLTAQTASASPADDALFNALNAAGFPLSGEAAIAAGELVCNSSTSGLAREVIAQQVSDRTGLDNGRANQFVGIAQAVYCPLR